MTLDRSNSSNLEQLALKGLIREFGCIRVSFTCFLLIILSLVVNTSAFDCIERLVHEMIDYVLSGTLRLRPLTVKTPQTSDGQNYM